MAKLIEHPQAPGGADLAKHPTLWGHPLPLWGDTGPVYAHGSHWTDQTVGELTLWLGDCLKALREWVHGPETHRRILVNRMRLQRAFAQARAEGHKGLKAFPARVEVILEGDQSVDPPVPALALTKADHSEIEAAVVHAERARQYLWNIASASDPKTRPSTMDELAQWTTRSHPDLVLRLSVVHLVPKPPERIIPASMPRRTPTRQAKLDAKPSADPAGEDIF